jgi:hypothetical protein
MQEAGPIDPSLDDVGREDVHSVRVGIFFEVGQTDGLPTISKYHVSVSEMNGRERLLCSGQGYSKLVMIDGDAFGGDHNGGDQYESRGCCHKTDMRTRPR